MNEIYKKLVHNWRNAGIEQGDVLLLHSSIKRTLKKYRKDNPNLSPMDILQSFIDAVGISGTLLLPLFNFDFTKGIPFDIRYTKSRMGVITEAGRNYSGAVRTGHPVYSFAVIGKYAHNFKDVDNYSGYGADSPFGLLHDMEGKIGVLDLEDQQSMTFYHYVEQMQNADYRYHKQFTAPYTDWSGVTQKKTYSIFVRDINRRVVTNVNPAGHLMWQSGLYTGDYPGKKSGFRAISTVHMYDFVSSIIKSGKASRYLYKINGIYE